MAVFGRLDVLYPDGQRQSHQLDGERLTVGSASANYIRLADEAVAASHFRIDVKADVVSITDLDSETGTFVSGQRLQAQAPRKLRAVEEIRVGALRLTYYQRNDSPTQAMPAFGEQTQPTGLDFRASLQGGEFRVFPASNATISLEVSNLGRAEASFSIETSGLPEGWIKPERAVFPLPANETTQIQFQIKPARRSDMSPGDYPLTISVRRQGDLDQVLPLAAIIQLGGFSGLSLALAPELCRDGDSFSLFLLNQGNIPLRLALDLRHPQGGLSVALDQTRVELPAGGRRRISGQARARRRSLIGKPVERPFAVIARSMDPGDYSVAIPARVRVQPRLSYRAATALALALFVMLLAAAAIFVGTLEPGIISFELSQAQVARGTPVQLDWRAANAQRYVIEVDRARLADLPGDAEAYTLDTAGYVKPVDIALIALRGEARAIATRRLDVYEPLVIVRFEANQTAMLSRVAESLIVRWEVTGAVSLDVSHPLEFETLRESASTAMLGEIELRGAPDDDFDIKLIAVDERGAVAERSITITVKAPECLPLHDALLYAGPGRGFQQVRLAVENVPVLARGTVADRDWLQVELASGRTGWGLRSDFECRGFDVGALALISDAPQLPTASASPSPTAAPTVAAARAGSPSVTPPPASAASAES